MDSNVCTELFPDLIRAAAGAFLAEGYRRTRLCDVGSAMGVARATLCLHVESKGALVEAEQILRELHAVVARNPTANYLLNRCANEYSDLAAAWFPTGREGVLGLLTAYLLDRTRSGVLRDAGDVAVAARVPLGTLTFRAVHRHRNPSPQRVEEDVVSNTFVSFLLAAILEG